MLDSVKHAIYNIYSWSMRKLRSTTLDLIALFNKKYADRKRIEYAVYDTLKIDTTKIEAILKQKFITSDLLIERDINLAIEPLPSMFLNDQYRDAINRSNKYKLHRYHLDLFSHIREFEDLRIADAINQSYKYKLHFSEMISKLNQDEYARFVDNLDLIFPLMLRYKNFVHSDWVSDKYSRSALIELIKTCDSRKAMEEKIDLWEREEKLLLDRSMDTDTLIHITAMFSSVEKAIRDKDFIHNYGLPLYGYQVYDLVNELKENTRGEARRIVDDLVTSYEKYDSNRDLVLLLQLVCNSFNYIGLIKPVIINSNSRDAIIQKIYSLQEKGELSINSRKNLDLIIKMLPIIERLGEILSIACIKELIHDPKCTENSGCIIRNCQLALALLSKGIIENITIDYLFDSEKIKNDLKGNDFVKDTVVVNLFNKDPKGNKFLNKTEIYYPLGNDPKCDEFFKDSDNFISNDTRQVLAAGCMLNGVFENNVENNPMPRLKDISLAAFVKAMPQSVV